LLSVLGQTRVDNGREESTDLSVSFFLGLVERLDIRMHLLVPSDLTARWFATETPV
jgi:hypothetical protein